MGSSNFNNCWDKHVCVEVVIIFGNWKMVGYQQGSEWQGYHTHNWHVGSEIGSKLNRDITSRPGIYYVNIMM